MPNGKPAIFLDRDGTLIVETGYLHAPEKVELIPGAGEAVQRLADGGFELFIVTNQAGIGRGYYAEEQMHAVNERVAGEFAKFGVAFRKIYFAPEAPEQPSRNRKPSPQMLLDARDEGGIDLDKLNGNGGAIALGHPFGMTGARIMTTLLNGLEDTDGEFGVEAMCVGGGQGMAMVVQRLS